MTKNNEIITSFPVRMAIVLFTLPSKEIKIIYLSSFIIG
ncbi:hypothetical protein SD78_3139 [Bacillus badius]|nr:hypothetical protein SD78_3139 [Bacillus badius]